MLGFPWFTFNLVEFCKEASWELSFEAGFGYLFSSCICLLVNLSPAPFMHQWMSLDFCCPYLFRFHEVSMRQWWTKKARLNNDGLMQYLCGATLCIIVHLITYVPLDLRHDENSTPLSFLASSDIFEPFFLSIQMRTSCWLLSLDKDGLAFFFLQSKRTMQIRFFLFFSFVMCVYVSVLMAF